MSLATLYLFVRGVRPLIISLVFFRCPVVHVLVFRACIMLLRPVRSGFLSVLIMRCTGAEDGVKQDKAGCPG